MQLTRIKLKNMTPLHLGKGKDSYDVSSPILQSDTLASALASVRAMTGKTDDVQDFLESFTISSAFPYDGDEFFFPRPSGRLNIIVEGLPEEKYRKKLKSLRFITADEWMRLIKGEQLEIHPNQLQGEFLISRHIDSQTSPYSEPTMRIINQRVQVPREENKDSEPFMFEWTYFHHGERETGLYCLVQTDDDQRTEELKELFVRLGEQGVGSDRSVGGGHFDIEADTIELPTITDANATMLLSTYIPQKQELSQLDLSKASFSVFKRGGFLAGSTNESATHLRRKTVYMFDAGSVFPETAPLQGQVVDVTPEWKGLHHVYRSGKPLGITIKIS